MSRTVITLLLAAAASAQGAMVSYDAPLGDKWSYSNADSGQFPYGGASGTASVFAFLNTDDTDRLGGMVVTFGTGADIPTGLSASDYVVTSVKLTITLSSSGTFLYDPTYDSYRTYLPTNHPDYVADSDSGRPVEVYGIGLNAPYTRLSASANGSTTEYGENSPFATGGVPNAFPLGSVGGQLVDVADNVSDTLDPIPFGLAFADGETPGTSLDPGTELTFDIALNRPEFLAYLSESLSRGVLGFYVSSLHAVAGQGGPPIYPRFFTKENELDEEFAPKLEITYSVVPEAHWPGLILVGVSLLALGRGWRKRNEFL